MGRELQDKLNAADRAFEDHEPQVAERETGFESQLADEDTQLRKGCRAITLARELVFDEREGLAHERHYAAAIELSFSCAERTSQAVLISCGAVSSAHSLPHEEWLARGHEAGLWTAEESEKLAALYQDNRAVHYYRRGIPSRTKAAALVAVAEALHRLAGASKLFESSTCLCKTSPA